KTPSLDYFSKISNVNLNYITLNKNFPTRKLFYEFEPYEYSVPTKTFKNPLPSDNFYVLERGRLLYSRFCIPCHNTDGRGNGPIIAAVVLTEDEEGFPQPKDLTSEHTRKLTDGRLFHILSAGQNLMFSFHDKMNDFDKWCVISYIRKLQLKK
ncbi:MAG: c-type cytochrome, partial [Candidatus Kapaibacteriota bacterium]